MPYVVLEAIAAGMPIIASDVGGIPEIFGPAAGALVPPGDPAALAGAIDAAFADPRRTDADAIARRAWLHPRFNISTMQNKVEALYRQMLESKYAEAA
jgi:glycosyltransferase involved in cell wall biosynthesis